MNDIRTRVLGVGSYVAKNVVTNFDLEKMVDTSDEWITERTGIKERRVVSSDVVTSDMAAHSLTQALDMAGLAPNDLDMIIVGTVTPDRPLPACAAFVQKKIGASNKCASFDLAAACAGFLYGLSIADNYIRLGKARHIGVVGVELLSRILDFEDRNTCVLFGDGAGAVVVGPDTSGRGILSTHLFTDGSLTDILTIPAGGSELPASHETVSAKKHYVQMGGREVYRWAVKYLAEAAELSLKENAVLGKDIDIVVAHQANIRILSAVSLRLNIPLDKFMLNIERFGNTSSASIPLALDEAVRAGRVKDNDQMLMIALGGGISWGSALLRW